jgi:hypothetical protein
MALIKCPECKHEISDKALECINCGYQLRKPKRGIMGTIFKWLFILFNLFMLLWIWSAGKVASDVQNSAEAVGAGVGITLIFILWALGVIILGAMTYFTKAKQ